MTYIFDKFFYMTLQEFENTEIWDEEIHQEEECEGNNHLTWELRCILMFLVM